MLNRNRLNKIDHLIKQLFQEKDKWISLAIAVDLADEIMKGILPDNPAWQSQLTRNVQETGELPRPLASDVFRTQKQNAWFHEHPESASARIALKHFWAEDCAIESHFFWINDSATKQKISASTELTPNWEDSDLTRRPDYKVGIDFFLTKEADALLMVISNKQRLKVMELKEKLSNTQKLLFEKNLNGAAAYTGIENGVRLEFEPQRTIHATIWNALEIKEVNRDFYRGIAALFEELVAHLTKSGKDKDNAKQFSSRLIGRLLFIWFLRKMDLINEQVDYFNTTGMTATKYYASKLKLLFFETLNTLPEKRTHDLITPFLNGGLFDFKENDYRHEEVEFPDGYFQRMYAHFEQFNFTTDESSSDFELIAVDPEMLGQVFEELLASQLNETGANERNRTGSFYTPREIVDYMCKETLRHYLYNKINNPIFNDGIDSLLDLSDSQFLNRKSTSQADLWGVNSRDVISNIIKMWF